MWWSSDFLTLTPRPHLPRRSRGPHSHNEDVPTHRHPQLNPTVDLVFKLLFGHEERKPLLIALLSPAAQFPIIDMLCSTQMPNRMMWTTRSLCSTFW